MLVAELVLLLKRVFSFNIDVVSKVLVRCISCFKQVLLPSQVGIVTWPHCYCWSTYCHHLQVERREL